MNLVPRRFQWNPLAKSEARNPNLAQPEPKGAEQDRGIRGIRGKAACFDTSFPRIPSIPRFRNRIHFAFNSAGTKRRKTEGRNQKRTVSSMVPVWRRGRQFGIRISFVLGCFVIMGLRALLALLLTRPPCYTPPCFRPVLLLQYW